LTLRLYSQNIAYKKAEILLKLVLNVTHSLTHSLNQSIDQSVNQSCMKKYITKLIGYIEVCVKLHIMGVSFNK